jgi:hypothetical protein
MTLNLSVEDSLRNYPTRREMTTHQDLLKWLNMKSYSTVSPQKGKYRKAVAGRVPSYTFLDIIIVSRKMLWKSRMVLSRSGQGFSFPQLCKFLLMQREIEIYGEQ